MAGIKKNENLYQDPHSGGWIAEYRLIRDRWTRLGVYGTREAAMAALVRARR